MSGHDDIRVPRPAMSPLKAILRRVAFAIGLVLFVATVVRVGRSGYVDVTGDPIGFLDAIYYASVTVTTTGYGDISAVSSSARLATVLLITPARILFLILVVSTTVEVLTEQTRILRAKQQWRHQVNDHTIICGFGATGRSAARDLLARGADQGSLVVVDLDEEAVVHGTKLGFIGVVGDATRTDILDQAGIRRARNIIVAPNRDDTAVLITLTARELNPTAHIVAGGREQENLHLLRQGGADEVIDATAAIGRMLGLGTANPSAVVVLDELLDAGRGLELAELSCTMAGPAAIPDDATLVAIVRNGDRLAQASVRPESIAVGDQIVVFRDRTLKPTT